MRMRARGEEAPSPGETAAPFFPQPAALTVGPPGGHAAPATDLNRIKHRDAPAKGTRRARGGVTGSHHVLSCDPANCLASASSSAARDAMGSATLRQCWMTAGGEKEAEAKRATVDPSEDQGG